MAPDSGTVGTLGYVGVTTGPVDQNDDAEDFQQPRFASFKALPTTNDNSTGERQGCAPQAVQFHRNGGQFDIVGSPHVRSMWASWAARVMSPTKSRKIPTRKILPYLLASRHGQRVPPLLPGSNKRGRSKVPAPISDENYEMPDIPASGRQRYNNDQTGRLFPVGCSIFLDGFPTCIAAPYKACRSERNRIDHPPPQTHRGDARRLRRRPIAEYYPKLPCKRGYLNTDGAKRGTLTQMVQMMTSRRVGSLLS